MFVEIYQSKREGSEKKGKREGQKNLDRVVDFVNYIIYIIYTIYMIYIDRIKSIMKDRFRLK